MSITLLLLFLVCLFIRPQDWMPLFYGKPIIYMISLATAFFLFVEQAGARGRRKGFISAPQNKLLIGFFLAILMSHIAHTYFGGLTLAFSRFLINLILYFLILNAVNSEYKLKAVIWFIVLLNLALVFQGMQQAETGFGWAGQPLTFVRSGAIRVNWIGIFSDPNDLALTFVIAVGLLLGFIFGEKGFLQRLIALPMLGFLLYGIYLTNSRGGLLALMATVYFYFVKRTNRLFWGSIIGGGAAFAMFTFGPSRSALFTVTESSAYSRVELWYEGILMMKSNPLFGVGYDMFTDSLPQTAHNSFILAGSELGLVGLCLWVALIYASYRGLSKVQEAVPSLRNCAYGLQSSLVGFCAAAFFLSRTYIILPYLLFALSGSIMHIAQEKDKSLEFKFTKKDIKMSIFLGIGSILIAYILIKVAL